MGLCRLPHTHVEKCVFAPRASYVSVSYVYILYVYMSHVLVICMCTRHMDLSSETYRDTQTHYNC